jgi:hypothetical protein|tara:strand:- start:257 stop:433 length:177 start_codon:yes stop_codon:yes gene_type:complete
MIKKAFSVSFIMLLDKNNNILSSSEDGHVEDVADLIQDIMYDIDDVKIRSLIVREQND